LSDDAKSKASDASSMLSRIGNRFCAAKSAGMPPNRQIGGMGASTLREQSILSLGKLHRCGALLVIIRHVIDSNAHRVTPHDPSIKGL
jgi:hypothetical protein